MSRSNCKQVDIWAAALHTGELEEPNRIRLMDHLDDCSACRRRAAGINSLVSMLRDEPAEFPQHRASGIWRRVEAASATAKSAPKSAPRRSRALFVAVACAAGLALGLAVGLSYLSDPSPEKGLHKGATAPAQELAKAPHSPKPSTAKVVPSPAPLGPAESITPSAAKGWEISWINGQASTDGKSLSSGSTLAQGDRLKVSRKGRALLVGPSEVMVVGEETSLDLVGGKAGASRIRLVQGQITILTRHSASANQPAKKRVEVAVGKLMVRPLGTVFSVSWSGSSAPEIALAEGKLEVVSPERTVTMVAPAKLIWGKEPMHLTGEAGRKLVERLTSSRKRAGSSSRIKSTPKTRPNPAAAKAPVAAISSLRDEMRALEVLLLGGASARVREKVEELLKRPGAMAEREAPALLSLVAESYLKQGKYAAARKAYLRTWRQFPRSLFGMDALYSAGSMALEQLGRADQARQHLETYLASYNQGRQREGAFYLLHRALTKQGQLEPAAEAAARYRAEFPSGQYRVLFK